MRRTHCVQSDSEILVIREATKLVGSKRSARLAIDRILRLLSELLGLNRGRVLLPDPETSRLHIRFAYGLTQAEKERGTYERGEGVTGRVMQTSRVGLIQDIDSEPMYLQRAVSRRTLPQETVSYIAVPILLDEEIVGVLGVHRLRHRERAFESDINILEILSTLIAQILRLHGHISESTAAIAAENPVVTHNDHPGAEYGLVGSSRALRRALRRARQVANTRASVMLLGESGTGKELFARLLHSESERCEGSFVAINCAAIPSELMESELFGHEKGAFSGAVSTKKGKLEAADGGTLFLDELAELDWDMQSKLLRALEERVIQRVGGNRDISVNLRIVAATNANLASMVSQGTFRADLYYRLNVFPVQLPSLRERREDIPALADHFLTTANREFNCHVQWAGGVVERLAEANWPGNVRQLENVVHRAVIMADDGVIDGELIEAILSEDDPILNDASGLPSRPAEPLAASLTGDPRIATEHESGSGVAGAARAGGTIDAVRPYWRADSHDAETLQDAIRQCSGNKTRAARMLGLTPRQLRYRLDKLGLNA
jgi:Nif-specific regulatory protein